MRTKCGWVWYEWADQQSIARWETEGGSYDPWVVAARLCGRLL